MATFKGDLQQFRITLPHRSNVGELSVEWLKRLKLKEYIFKMAYWPSLKVRFVVQKSFKNSRPQHVGNERKLLNYICAFVVLSIVYSTYTTFLTIYLSIPP